jgi:DNA-3-methyladenine glycosylase I
MADNLNSYCKALNGMKPGDQELHKNYHDHYYGFPIADDDELFCRLVLEINQAGLSWTTILKKEATFRAAYDGFSIKKVAAYTQVDIERLLADAGIIRNRLKVLAAIANANTILSLQQEFGSFKNWLDAKHPLNREEWTKLFKKTFRFTGGEIVNEFLLSTGYLPGAHHEGCSVYKKVLQSKPKWYGK